MRLVNKLERKYGKYAIKNLITYIVALNALGFILIRIDTTGEMIYRLALFPKAVLQGEIWRLVTYLFIPNTTSIFFILFALYFTYIVGIALEQEWGSFRFNLYYLLGMLGTTIAAFISGQGETGIYLNMSLILAFAYVFPSYEILWFGILPIKMKYIGWITAGSLGYLFLGGSVGVKLSILAAFVNFALFFGKDIYQYFVNRKNVANNRKNFNVHQHHTKRTTYHRCTVCGKTELDDRRLEFRYCSSCEGHYEYCMEHLKNHRHKTAEDNIIELEDYKKLKQKRG